MTKLAEADIIARHKTNVETRGSARVHNQEINARRPVNHRHSPNFSSPKLLDAQFAKLSRYTVALTVSTHLSTGLALEYWSFVGACGHHSHSTTSLASI